MADKSYVVTAACAMVKVGGRFVTVAKGAAVPAGADEEHVAVLLDRGMVVEGVPESGFEHDPELPPPFTVPESKTDDDVDGDGPIPAKSASRADWDAFAKSEAGGSLSDEDLKAFSSKEDLQNHYGVS